ncbi:MAG: ADP-ribosylglycohydrolase family protein [Candidatus Saccharimonas sp.]
MSHTDVSRVAELLLPAIAYGDAAGLPVETKSAAYIKTQYGRIHQLLPIQENPFYKGWYPAGTWSDDTQLSLAVAKALVGAGRFTLETIAEQHTAAYYETPQITNPDNQTIVNAWGKSTMSAVQRYMQQVPIECCGQPGGAGNGVIMKMAPLALLHIALDTPLNDAYRECDALTSFTHASSIARVATRVHLDTLTYLMSSPYLASEFASRAYESALYHQRDINTEDHRVSNALKYLTKPRDITTDEITTHTDGKGFIVSETLAMAYGAYMVHGGVFAPSVYEAVNLGGDTDSIASIVSAMAVFSAKGELVLPADADCLQNLPYLQAVSSSLARLIQTARQYSK